MSDGKPVIEQVVCGTGVLFVRTDLPVMVDLKSAQQLTPDESVAAIKTAFEGEPSPCVAFFCSRNEESIGEKIILRGKPHVLVISPRGMEQPNVDFPRMYVRVPETVISFPVN